MGVLPDQWIREQVIHNRMIEDFVDRKERNGVISYGLSSYGYDAKLGGKFKVFLSNQESNGFIDPKNFDESLCTEHTFDLSNEDYKKNDGGNFFIIPPHGFVLAETVEYFRIPKDVLVFCIGKSTYARCGLVIQVTPLEPEWQGKVTIEISNTTGLPARVYPGEGVIQCVFLSAHSICDASYADLNGKYMMQEGLTTPIV